MPEKTDLVIERGSKVLRGTLSSNIRKVCGTGGNINSSENKAILTDPALGLLSAVLLIIAITNYTKYIYILYNLYSIYIYSRISIILLIE
jgi:hypothetical protein